MSDSVFTISTRPSATLDSAAAIEVRGEIDVFTSSQMRAELVQAIDAGTRALVVDLDHVRYIDSTGIGVLVAVRKHAQRAGARILLAGLNRDVQRIFEITGLLQVFEIYPTALAAFTALGAPNAP